LNALLPVTFPSRICVIALAIAGCSTTSPTTFSRVSSVSIDGGSLVYRGPISYAANARLFELHEGSDSPISELVITSTGGDVAAGIELGLWVNENGLDVAVPEYCISSCANYVFTAGRRKVLGSTAAVVWHGGALQKEWNDLDCQLLSGAAAASCDHEELREVQADLLTALRAEEAAFFAAIGVDQRITILGQEERFDCRHGNATFIGWYYSLEDLDRLGVRDVSIAGGEWKPQLATRGVEICQVSPGIRLEWLPAANKTRG
jgi:hypothetical protein